jgi:hypothetical protein
LGKIARFCAILVLSGPIIANAEVMSARLSVLIATGMPGDTAYILGEAMASLWSDRLRKSGITVSAAVSEGARENIEALRISDADLIIADSPLCEMARRGKGLFKGRPVRELRSVAPLWKESLHLMIRSDLVKTGALRDLEGLTIVTGMPESGAKLLAETTLNAAGLKVGKKVKLRYMSNRKAAHALLRGRVQGLALVGAAPIPAIRDLMENEKIRLQFLSLNASQLNEVIGPRDVKLLKMAIPAGLYPGMRGPAQTVGVQKLLAVSSELDTHVVYSLTRALFNDPDRLVQAHPAAREISPHHDLADLEIPLHLGAFKYFEEKGLKTPRAAYPIERRDLAGPFK